MRKLRFSEILPSERLAVQKKFVWDCGARKEKLGFYKDDKQSKGVKSCEITCCYFKKIR
jgi:hypothetical protein